MKEDIAAAVPLFCFPEGNTNTESISTERENFSFILTSGDGSKRHGYCRRFMTDKYPECYCIISSL